MNWKIRVVVSGIALLFARQALAEKVLLHDDEWELFTNGRVGGFLSYTRGDGFPVTTATQTPFGGGIDANTAAQISDPSMPLVQGRLESMRVRSGFLGNILAVGVRHRYTQWTTLTGTSRCGRISSPSRGASTCRCRLTCDKASCRPTVCGEP